MYGKQSQSKASKSLDKAVKRIASEVFETLKPTIPYLTWKTHYKGDAYHMGCMPDAGMFYYQDTLIVTGEGKHQQDGGNAIERWFKNERILRKVEPNVTFITFASGSGAYEKGVIGKTLRWAHPDGYNNYQVGKNICYLELDGFDDTFIFEILSKAIKDKIALIE